MNNNQFNTARVTSRDTCVIIICDWRLVLNKSACYLLPPPSASLFLCFFVSLSLSLSLSLVLLYLIGVFVKSLVEPTQEAVTYTVNIETNERRQGEGQGEGGREEEERERENKVNNSISALPFGVRHLFKDNSSFPFTAGCLCLRRLSLEFSIPVPWKLRWREM